MRGREALSDEEMLDKEMKRTILVAIGAVAAIAALSYLFVAGPFSADQASPRPGPVVADASKAADRPDEADAAVTVPDPVGIPGKGGGGSSGNPGQSPAPDEEVWKERLQGLLNNDAYSDRELGRQLLKIAEEEGAPERVRVHAMANALNFTDDAHYAADVKPLAFRTDLPEAVNDVILDDLLNRDPRAILPVARELAAVGRHPLAGAIEEFVKSFEETEER